MSPSMAGVACGCACWSQARCSLPRREVSRAHASLSVRTCPSVLTPQTRSSISTPCWPGPSRGSGPVKAPRPSCISRPSMSSGRLQMTVGDFSMSSARPDTPCRVSAAVASSGSASPVVTVRPAHSSGSRRRPARPFLPRPTRSTLTPLGGARDGLAACTSANPKLDLRLVRSQFTIADRLSVTGKSDSTGQLPKVWVDSISWSP
jgi:hypothetical protein